MMYTALNLFALTQQEHFVFSLTHSVSSVSAWLSDVLASDQFAGLCKGKLCQKKVWMRMFCLI